MMCNAMIDNLFYGVSFVDFQTFISGRMWNVINPGRRERERFIALVTNEKALELLKLDSQVTAD